MIPKKIHYCWFGTSKKPRLVDKCINSWKLYCSDFEIIEWNENNFDVSKNEYTKYCFKENKWAFLSDYARLAIIYEHGGIYFDTDVEVIRPIDELLQCSAFYGFENDRFVATGLGFGAVAGERSVWLMIEKYLNFQSDRDGIFKMVGCPNINTDVLVELGLKRNGQFQTIQGINIYPRDYFNPYDDNTGVLSKTDNTFTINHYGKSWMSKGMIIRSRITQQFHRIFGVDCFSLLRREDKS